MQYSKDQIENKAVNAVKDLLDEVPSLENDLNTLDKKPFIDGVINVYNVGQGESKIKSKFKGSLNLQVKGVTNKRIIKNNKFSIERVDLKGFYNTGGCIYFVVYIDNHDKKVFYNDLQLYDIKRILDTNNSQSISLSFKEFPENPLEIKKIIHTFLIHQQSQNKNLLDANLKDLNEDTITIKYYGNEHDLEKVINNGTYTYITTPEGVEIANGKIIEDSLILLNGQKVILENKKTIDLFSEERNDGNFTLFFANYLSLKFYDSKVTLNMNFIDFDNLQGLIEAISNVESIFKKGIYINDYYFNPIKYFKEKNINDELQSLYKFKLQLKRILELLKELHVPTDFNYFDLDVLEKQKLNELTKKFNDETINGLFDMEFNDRYYFFIKTPKIQGNIFHLNSSFYAYAQYDKVQVNILPSLIPNQYLYKLQDFHPESIKEDITTLYEINSDDEETSMFVNNYLLDLLRNYDKSKEVFLLDLSEFVADILIEKSPSNISTINYLQVLKRQRMLNKLEVQYLNNLKSKTNDLREMIGIKILLEENDTKDLIEKLTNNEKAEIKGYPIMKLL